MKLSALQLEGYALIDLSFRANQEYQVDKATEYGEEDIVVTSTLNRDAADEHRWVAGMKFQLQPRANANGPYHIALQIMGVFRTDVDFSEENIEVVVKVNSSSVLYGIARETVRNITGMGPYQPVLIPTLNFRPDSKPAIQDQEAPAGRLK